MLAAHIVFYLSLFIITATLIPLIRNDFWIFRVFEYPRLQKLLLNAALLLVTLLFFFPQDITHKIVLAGLVINLGYLAWLVYPFTVFAPKQIVKSRYPAADNNINVLIANVFQYNTKYNKYFAVIEQCSPDVILLVETNEWWQDKMEALTDRYPHQIKVPLENTYGMLLYSRLKLTNGAVKYLVEDDIPSIEVNVTLSSGQLVKLYCLHPQPPVPQENPRSTERDKEILLVGQKARNSDIPVLVMGDLNDVAWSYTTELFSKTSGLLDPRRGRGFFNSFNARYFFLRFPLDHIFCSADFTLTSIKRMNSCGSDHFPMCVNLQFDPGAKAQNQKPVASRDDKELAAEKINEPT